jgi:YD repeat-containing protein
MLKRCALSILRSLAAPFYNIYHVSSMAVIIHHGRNAHYLVHSGSIQRIICFIICFGLILSSRPSVSKSLSIAAEKSRVRLTQGPPGLNLPNLNETRRINTGVPRLVPPVSAGWAPRIEPSAAASLTLQEDNWPMALIDQRNRVGRPGEDLLSRNYNWSEPVVNLPGRAGMNLNLALVLNSLIWTKSGTNIHFDLDQGFPTPGFRLGLPELGTTFYNTETATGSMLVTMPSGQRYEFRQNPALGANVYEEQGSTYMVVVITPGLFDYRETVWRLLLTDGTTYKFEVITNNPKCTEIKDRNGNYISISYTEFEEIRTMTDTLERIINFNYDGSNRLGSITQNWGGGTHTYARFAYDAVTIETNFPGLDLVGTANGNTISVLSRVDLADGKVYAFEYNTYGQVTAIECYGPNSADPDNFPDDYRLISRIAYDLTADEGAAQTDCPRFSERRDWARDWNDGVITTYTGDGNSWGEVTVPDGTTYKEYFGATGWQRGLTLEMETWSNGVRKKWTTSTWVNDNPSVSYWLNPRVVETNVYDEKGNQQRTTLAYADFGAVSDIREYNAPPNTSTVLRHTHIDYLRGTAYTGNLNRRLTQLVTSQTVSDGNGTLHSKVTYEYDLGGEYLIHQGPPVRHDTTKFGTSFVQGRGNMNRVRRWDVTDPNNINKSSTTTIGYNTSGSMIFSRNPLNHESRLSYTDAFSDTVARNTLAYPTRMTDADNYSSTIEYNYDIGAVTRTEDPKGSAVVNTYDAIGRIERVTNQVNGAYTRYVYAPDHLSIKSFTTVKDLDSELYQITVFDGHGRARGIASEHPGSAGGYKAQYNEYDIMGRLARQSNLTETDEDWEPAGDDAGGWAWRERTYDWQGRPTIMQNQDGTTRLMSYEGCGCAGGAKVVTIDEVGRRREQNYDVLGRMWRERTYHWGGSNETGIYTTTTNTYNILDQVTKTSVLDNASGVSQSTVTSYDGHGRLKTRQLPKYLGSPQSATPYDSYQYNADDSLKLETDPRGATASYSYNKRGLVTSIGYGGPSGVAATPSVTFEYDEIGNRTLMDDGPGMVTYTYNEQNRLTSETRVIDRLSRYIYQTTGQPHQSTFTIGYNYNLAGQLTQIQTPTGDAIEYTLDKSGRVTGVSGTPRDGITDYITDIKYRAFGAAKQVSYGYSNYTITTEYNSRMLISRIDDQASFGVAYGYNFDGTVSTIEGLRDSARTLDRSLSYDHLGRTINTRSGSEAGLGSTEPEQLKQHYIYDAFDHMTTRRGRYWYTSSSETIESAFTASYSNDRGMNVVDKGTAQNWEYDELGNIKRSLNSFGFYDLVDRNARGQAARTTFEFRPGEPTGGGEEYYYDGDGNLVLNYTTFNSEGDRYYVRSTVLSKNLLSGRIGWGLVNGQYLIRRSFPSGNEPVRDLTERSLAIIVGGEEVAVRKYETFSSTENNKVIWQHRDPYNSIAKIAGRSDSASGVYSVDPLGVLVVSATQELYDSYWNPPGGGDPSPPSSGYYSDQGGSSSSYGYSHPFPGGWGLNCYVDGIQRPCEQAFRLIANGSANVEKVNSPTGSVNVPGLNIIEESNESSTSEGGYDPKDGKIKYTTTIEGTTTYRTIISSLFLPNLSAPTQNLQVNATPDQINTFREAFNEALRRLDDSDCFGLFSPILSAGYMKGLGEYGELGYDAFEDVREAFQSVEIRFLNLGAPRRDPVTGDITVTGASTNPGYNPSIFINRQGPFFNQNLYVPGVGYRHFDLGSGLTGKNFGAFILLHELGHLVRKFQSDAGDSDLNQRYSQEVLDACFKDRRR